MGFELEPDAGHSSRTLLKMPPDSLGENPRDDFSDILEAALDIDPSQLTTPPDFQIKAMRAFSSGPTIAYDNLLVEVNQILDIYESSVFEGISQQYYEDSLQYQLLSVARDADEYLGLIEGVKEYINGLHARIT